jgi:hypothetical protein
MGHARFGRLPKSDRWKQVVGLLESSPANTARTAHASAFAAERRLRELRNDPSLSYCFWLLTRLTSAARGDDFIAEAARLGVQIDPGDPTLTFISRVTDAARRELSAHTESGHYSEIASLAMRRALSETVGQYTRAS